MLNVGIIGNTANFEQIVDKIKHFEQVHIIGKASIGKSEQLTGFHFSIPEFNKIELIERADVLLMDNSNRMPFKLMREIIIKSKHIFCTEYPDLTIEECSELNKLVNESGAVIQVTNPYFFSSAIQWMNDNIKTPAFFDFSNFEQKGTLQDSLYSMLLMLIGTTGISPKKVGAVTFPGYDNSKFTNVRLEFSDASIVNLNFGTLESLKNFKLRIYADNQFATFNFSKQKFILNNNVIPFDSKYHLDEFQVFFDTVWGKAKKTSTLEDYLIAMHVTQKINKKISLFTVQ